MTEQFKKIVIPWIFKWEGTTYENDPDDPGGETKFGIDKRSHESVDIPNLTADQAADIYWTEWIKDGCQGMPWPLSFVFFNCAVNCGLERAREFMVSSRRNPKTFLDIQEDHYRDIVRRRPRSQKFLRGWLARTEDLRKVALG